MSARGPRMRRNAPELDEEEDDGAGDNAIYEQTKQYTRPKTAATATTTASGSRPPSRAATASTGGRIKDVYGFKLKLTMQQQTERIMACGPPGAELTDDQIRSWSWVTTGTIPKEATLKKLCREGVPAQYRGRAWMVISGASELQACRPANYYRRLAKIEPTPVVIDQIDADLPRTFPNHPWIQDEGQEPLRRILIAFAMHNVSLGYTQGLNSVAALLLLAADREEETTFWLLNALVQGKVAPDTYAPTLAGAHIEMNTLGVLVEEKCPNIAKHFDRMKEPKCIPALYSTEWFICLFSTSFPSETTARVWDCLFNEGSKILFRVALSILKLSEQQLMSCDHSGDVLETIKEAAANMHNHNKLMTMAMDGLGSFPQSRIDKIRSEESVHVNAMLADLEAQRRKRELKSKLEAEQRRRDMEAERQMEQDIPDSRADEIQKAAKATAEKTKDVLTKGFGFIAAGVKKLGQDAMNGFPMPQDDEAPRPSKQGKASRYDDEDDEEDGGWDERQRGLPKRPPPRPSASTSTAASSVSRANAAAEETRRKLVERGEKLKGVDERVSEMTNEASGFADLAEKLKQQQRRQGPWGGLFS